MGTLILNDVSSNYVTRNQLFHMRFSTRAYLHISSKTIDGRPQYRCQRGIEPESFHGLPTELQDNSSSPKCHGAADAKWLQRRLEREHLNNHR